MKSKVLQSLLIATFIIAGAMNITKAQDIDLGAILEPGVADANQYMQEFTRPAILSFANGMANGWYNTAKPHKLLGVDLTFSLNTANIPDEERFFNFNDFTWNNMTITGDDQLPTLVGGTTDKTIQIPAGATITDPSTGQSITYDATQTFDAIDGFDLDDAPISGVPVPTLQLGIGLIKNTDLKIRLVPEVTFDDFSFNMWGVGVQHDIKQWIPGMKLVPIDISALLAHTSMSAEFTAIDINQGNFQGTGSADFNVSATTFQVLASKNLLFFTPYIGLGFNVVSSDFNLNGTYVFSDVGESLTITDPLSFEYDGGGGGRVTIGGRLKLLVLTLHADYTIQEYSTFTAGLGISVR